MNKKGHAMQLQHGKKYRVREQGSTYSELVTVEHVSAKGMVTIAIGGFWGEGGRLDLTPKRVAQLEWEIQ
jgi:hypothetical protein